MPHWRSAPVGLPALAVMAVAFGIFLGALLVARRRTGPRETSGGKRDARSLAGICVQAAGIAAVGFGTIDVRLDPMSPAAWLQAATVALLMAAAIGLFFTATRHMGRNWAIVASTRSDHRLVTDGPFAHARNPIYIALFVFMLALSVAYGHYRQLAVGVPLYVLGTILRVRIEERMLRARFGTAFDDYAAKVKRFGIV